MNLEKRGVDSPNNDTIKMRKADSAMTPYKGFASLTILKIFFIPIVY
jgi:hypothetical protein